MRKNSKRLLVKIDLGKNFMESINETMEKEFKTAQKKWGLTLNTTDEDKIFQHALNQLRRKTSEITKTNWDFSETLTVKVNSQYNGEEIYISTQKNVFEENIDEKTEKFKNLTFKATRDGWEQMYDDDDSGKEPIPITEFGQKIQQLILEWAKIAVFYGVGSYT